MVGDVTAGQSATLTLEMTDANDQAVVASAVIWQILDEDGEVIAGATVDDFVAGSGTVTFTIEPQHLELPQGEAHAGREILLTATTDNGDVEIRDYFVLVGSQPLIRYGNTLLTYPEALAKRRDFGPTLDGWDGADEKARIGAMVHAHANLSRIAYFVRQLPSSGNVRDYAAYGTGDGDCLFEVVRKIHLSTMTAPKFAELPADFKKAIKRAQLIEADVLLGGDLVGRVRQDGIISETIGESSTFYSSKPFMNLAINRRTYEVLKAYIRIRIGVSR